MVGEAVGFFESYVMLYAAMICLIFCKFILGDSELLYTRAEGL